MNSWLLLIAKQKVEVTAVCLLPDMHKIIIKGIAPTDASIARFISSSTLCEMTTGKGRARQGV